MLILHLKKKAYDFPSEWNELSPEQYIYLTKLLRLYQQGILKAGEVRVMYFLKVAGLIPRRFRKKEKEDLYSENVYRASNMIGFFFKLVYHNQKAFDNLDPELQKLILRTDPDDLPDKPEIRAARKLNRHLEVDAIFPNNLLPVLPGTKLKGFRFNLDNEFLDTSITASQYVDAYSVFEVWAERNDRNSLNLMAAILYQGDSYSSKKAHEQLPIIEKLPEDVKYGVMLNFMAIHLFMSKRTKYAILFSGTGSDKKGKISLGFHDSIYSLIKAGYGDVENDNLVKFLDLMLKELKDSVKALHDMDMKLDEIASKTKLTALQVKSLI